MKSRDFSFSFLLKLREAWKEKQSSSQKILLSYKPFSVNWNTLGPSVLGRPFGRPHFIFQNEKEAGWCVH